MIDQHHSEKDTTANVGNNSSDVNQAEVYGHHIRGKHWSSEQRNLVFQFLLSNSTEGCLWGKKN